VVGNFRKSSGPARYYGANQRLRRNGARASAYLKAQMKEADVTYAELVKRLKKHGLKETEAGITMKLKRGTFSATTCLAAMELGGVVLEEI
jgi:nanoRNase/pAp phosphatase (c-di-AMP/oligoRNAs hydrolase)